VINKGRATKNAVLCFSSAALDGQARRCWSKCDGRGRGRWWITGFVYREKSATVEELKTHICGHTVWGFGPSHYLYIVRWERREGGHVEEEVVNEYSLRNQYLLKFYVEKGIDMDYRSKLLTKIA
jgi:hypothetical protein